MTKVVFTGELEKAALRLREINLSKKELAEEEAECKLIIMEYLAVGDRGLNLDGEEIITVRAGARRFDPAMAAENLPKEVLAQITTLQVDPQRAKSILAPALFDLCCTENKPSVIVL